MKQKKTFFRVLRRIRPYSFFVILSILCGAVSVAAQLLVPIFCGDAIDYMLGIGRVDFEAVEKLIFFHCTGNRSFGSSSVGSGSLQ